MLDKIQCSPTGNTPGDFVETLQEPLPLPDNRAERSPRGWDVPVLAAPRGGPAKRLGDALGQVHPAIVFLVTMLAGLAAIAGLSIVLGAFVTRLLEPAWGIGAADERVNVWFAAHRTTSRTHASLIGSTIAGGIVLPILVGSLAIVCLLFRKWLIAAFLVFVLGVESASYRATTLVIHSHRPRVVRLEHLPVNASYPSGHTAASVAVYGGLALLLTSRFTNSPFRASAWALALAIVAYVAVSRMYRGMHHPLDIGGGIVVGFAAIGVIVFACRTAAAAAASRDGNRK